MSKSDPRSCPICNHSPIFDDQEYCPVCGTWMGVIEPEPQESHREPEQLELTQAKADGQGESSLESIVAIKPSADENEIIQDVIPVLLVDEGVTQSTEDAITGPLDSQDTQNPSAQLDKTIPLVIEEEPISETLLPNEAQPAEVQSSYSMVEETKSGPAEEEPANKPSLIILVPVIIVLLLSCFLCYRGGSWLIARLNPTPAATSPIESYGGSTQPVAPTIPPSQTPEPTSTPPYIPTASSTPTITLSPTPTRTVDISGFPSYTWKSSIIDRNKDTGVYNSQAIDANGTIHIAYFDDTNEALKYASSNQGSWITDTVDSDKHTGYTPSLALDSRSSPHIAYFDRSGVSLNYARRIGNRWDITTVATGVEMTTTVLVLDAQDRPLILYLDAAQTALVLAQKSGSSWSRKVVVQASPDGDNASMVMDSQGNLYISYYDFGLKYIRRMNNTWEEPTTVEEGPGIGTYSALVLDESGAPHISYFDKNSNLIRYARYDGSSWALQSIDPGVTAGIFSAIAIDPDGFIHIAYSDASNRTLKYAIGKDGFWQEPIILDKMGPTNQYISLSLQLAGTLEISYFDTANRIFRHLSGVKGSGSPLSKTPSTPKSTSISPALDTAIPEPGNSQPEISIGGGGSIAFCSDRAGNYDIYTMDLAGSNVTQLTTYPGDDRVPAWSPDGSEIAYQSYNDGDYELTVVDLSDRSTHQITSNGCNDYAPNWSPDGQQLVYYSDCDGNREIYTINVDGNNSRQLTFTDQVYNWFPTWSPDGKLITFSSNRSGIYHIYTMNPNGSNVQALDVVGCVSSFSPEGQKIMFASYCTDYGDIYTMNLAGENLTAITQNGQHRNPAYSRDGTAIVFQSYQSGNDDIWVMDLASGEQFQLTTDPGIDSAPAWQP
jgi:Tol biopolymer transport system component